MKKIAVYGTYKLTKPMLESYWKMRKDGVMQRYWRKVTEGKGRYEFHGEGKDLYKAVVKAHRFMPKGFITVDAEEFLEHPEEYGLEGEWVEREVEYEAEF